MLESYNPGGKRVFVSQKNLCTQVVRLAHVHPQEGDYLGGPGL